MDIGEATVFWLYVEVKQFRQVAGQGSRTGGFAVITVQTRQKKRLLDEPGLFIATSGAESNPWPEKRRFTLRGAKAGRVVCALALEMTPVGVRKLAAVAGTDPGYVSRLLGMLDREAIVDRTAHGRVERVDWRKLLLRWSEQAPVDSRAVGLRR